MIESLRMFAALGLSLLFLTGCQMATLVPEARFDESFDFSDVNSYTWVNACPLYFHALESDVGRDLEKILMSHTSGLLSAVGMKKVDDIEDADLAISFQVGSETRRTIRKRRPQAVVYDEFVDWQDYWPNSGLESASYVAGQICVDMYSVREERRVWHGTVRDLTLDTDGSFDPRTVEKILDLILANFPPREPQEPQER